MRRGIMSNNKNMAQKGGKLALDLAKDKLKKKYAGKLLSGLLNILPYILIAVILLVSVLIVAGGTETAIKRKMAKDHATCSDSSNSKTTSSSADVGNGGSDYQKQGNASSSSGGGFVTSAETDKLPEWDGVSYAEPVKGGVVSSHFNEHRVIDGREEYHNGTDIAAPEGAPLVASLGGIVIKVENRGPRGNLVAWVFKNKGGSIMTMMYQHMQNPSPLKYGDKIEMGQFVGNVGHTGGNYGPHLHAEIGYPVWSNIVPSWADVYPTDTTKLFDFFQFLHMKGGSGSNGANAGGSPTTPSRCNSSGKVVTSVEGNDNVEKAYKFFIQQGFTKEGAAGIVGNLMVESSVNPLAGEAGGNGGGRGIAQWGQGGTASNGANAGSRWHSLESWAKTQNMNPDDLVTQLNFIIKEMGDYGMIEQFKSINQLYTEGGSYGGGAVGVFAEKFEKPSIKYANMPQRVKYAEDTLAKYGG